MSKIDYDLFEYIILKECLQSEAYLTSVMDIIKPSFFGDKDVQKIYKLIILFYRKKSRIPNDVELDLYSKNDKIKKALPNVRASIANLKGYVDPDLLENTEGFIKERGFLSTINDLIEQHEEIDLSKEGHKYIETLDKYFSTSLHKSLGLDYFGNIDDFIDEISTEKKYMSTGFSWLDKKIGGGFLEKGKALYVFSGATNSGKSILLGNCASNLANAGKNVVVVSLEMSEEVYATRITGQLAGINIKEIIEHKIELQEFCKNHLNTKKSKLFIKEYPNNTITVNHIRNYISDLRKKFDFKPDAIIVDYINLINARTMTGDSYKDVKRVTEDLRAMSYEFEVPVITATQLGRDAYNKETPGIETVSESIGIAQTADVQISVFSSDVDRANGIINLGMQKNRYGENFGHKPMMIDWTTLKVEEFEDEMEEEDGEIDSVDDALGDLEF